MLGALIGAQAAWAQSAPAQFSPAPFTTEIAKKPVPSAPLPVGVERSPWSDIAPLLPRSADSSSKVQVLRIEVRGDTRRTDIVLLLARRTTLSTFVVADPLRVIIDAAGIDFEGVDEKPATRRTLINNYRYGPLETGTGRLLFDTSTAVKVSAISGRRIEGGTEVTITILPMSRAPLKDLPPITWGATPDGPAPTFTERLIPLLIIDPGHGGVDPGAVADHNVYEKNVVLAVALRLKGLLDVRGKVRVALTRQGDETVPLDKRVAIARVAKADLFVSLHADTFAGQTGADQTGAAVRGGSVYVLGAQASSAVAGALAEKENTADHRAGIAAVIEAGDAAVDGILADLTARETQTLSRTFQDTLVRNLRRSILLAREPTRAAAFRVLRQAETPAVLVELGYMSNGQDIALLQSADWQTAVATRIADAVEAYFARPRGFALDR